MRPDGTAALDVLAAYQVALQREAHVLTERPDLVFQQLHNRLQWETGAVGRRLDPERTRHSEPGARPWLRSRTPLAESSSLVRTLAGHADGIDGCAFSADGQLIFSWNDQTLTVTDATSGVAVRTVAAGAGSVRVRALSPDGRRMVASGEGSTLDVKDTESGAGLATLAGNTERVAACAFSPDGRRIVSGSVGGTLKVWDAESGAELGTRAGASRHMISACAFSPDGRRIVTDADGYMLKVWDAESVTELRTLTGHTAGVQACAYSPDGRRIVSGSGDEFAAEPDTTLRVWDADTGALLRTLSGHWHPVLACAFSLDGRRIVSGSEDGTVRIWDAESGAELAKLVGHTGSVEGCAFSPDGRRIASWGSGRRIASWGSDHSIKVWDASRTEGSTPARHGGSVLSCAFSADGRQVVSGSRDGTLKLWDADSGTELRSLNRHTGSVQACAFSADGRRVVSASADGPVDPWSAEVLEDRTLKVWDTESGATLRTLAGHPGWVRACAFSPDGRRIVSGGGDAHQFFLTEDRTLRIWDADAGTALQTLAGHTADVFDCAVSPDGRWIVSASKDQTLKVWDAQSGAEARTLAGHSGWVLACAFSPDSGRIVSGSTDGSLKVWAVESGAELRTLEAHGGAVKACAFSPDGRHVLGSTSATLGVWDAGSGDEVATFSIVEPVVSIALDPRQLRLAFGDGGGAVHILDLVGVEPWPEPSADPPPPAEGTIEFYPDGLLSKFGFGDGDMLVELMEEHHLQVDRSELLAAVVERLVVPRLDQRVETYTLASMHNPIRARTVDGEAADIHSDLTPEFIEVPIGQIIAVAGTLPTVDDKDEW